MTTEERYIRLDEAREQFASKADLYQLEARLTKQIGDMEVRLTKQMQTLTMWMAGIMVVGIGAAATITFSIARFIE